MNIGRVGVLTSFFATALILVSCAPPPPVFENRVHYIEPEDPNLKLLIAEARDDLDNCLVISRERYAACRSDQSVYTQPEYVAQMRAFEARNARYTECTMEARSEANSRLEKRFEDDLNSYILTRLEPAQKQLDDCREKLRSNLVLSCGYLEQSLQFEEVWNRPKRENYVTGHSISAEVAAVCGPEPVEPQPDYSICGTPAGSCQANFDSEFRSLGGHIESATVCVANC